MLGLESGSASSPELVITFWNSGSAMRLVGGVRDLVDDSRGRAGRREQAEEQEADHVRYAELDGGRDVRRRREPVW